jgi:trk system potassium uptake protein
MSKIRNNDHSSMKPLRSCAVIGLGRFGIGLALALDALGCRVQGIDRDATIVHRLQPTIPCALLDASDEEALRRLGIANFDTVVVAIGTDFESNVMVTAALKLTGAPHIICQAGSETHGEILLRVGAHQIVEPLSEAGRLLAAEIIAQPGDFILMARELLALPAGP